MKKKQLTIIITTAVILVVAGIVATACWLFFVVRLNSPTERTGSCVRSSDEIFGEYVMCP